MYCKETGSKNKTKKKLWIMTSVDYCGLVGMHSAQQQDSERFSVSAAVPASLFSAVLFCMKDVMDYTKCGLF